MAKLVLLSAGLTGRSYELKVDKATVGRVEDNTFQIAEPSISSHHCEILLRGADVVVKDLNSTNGTFINGERVTAECVLKPGQTLRLGQIEMRLETDEMAKPKKSVDQTVIRGVSLTELEQGTRTSGFDTPSKGFSKKTNQTNRLFWAIVAIVGLVIIVVLAIAFNMLKK
jgi:pSer/pThr/pTyr-binding forkhead associated (FHA) protein